jgi:hypothetical protein
MPVSYDQRWRAAGFARGQHIHAANVREVGVQTIRGWCPVCEQLVRIIPGAWKPGLRRQHWWPARHQNERGEDCEGADRSI